MTVPDEPSEDVLELGVADLIDALRFGEGAPSDRVAAAVAAAVGAHLADHTVARRVDNRCDPPERVGDWMLAGRLDEVGAPRRRRPREVRRGREWQAAARSL